MTITNVATDTPTKCVVRAARIACGTIPVPPTTTASTPSTSSETTPAVIATTITAITTNIARCQETAR